MPTQPTVTYQIADERIDVQDIFRRIQQPQTPLLNIAMSDMAVTSKRVEWWDDQRYPSSVTLDAAYTAADPSLTVVSSEGVFPNDLVSHNATVFRVTAVPGATTLTVTAIKNDANIANGERLNLHKSAEVENKQYEGRDYTPKVQRFNVTQIKLDFIEFSGTAQAVGTETPEDVVSGDTERKLERLRLGLGRDIWVNPLVEPSDNTTPRIAAGVDHYITTYGFNTTPAAFDIDAFDDFILELNEVRSAGINQVWMNPAEISNFTAVDKDNLNKEYDDPQIGRTVQRYLTKHGFLVSLVDDINAPKKALYAFNSQQVVVPPLNRRGFGVEPLGKTGDGNRWILVGEHTLLFQSSWQTGKFNIS